MLCSETVAAMLLEEEKGQQQQQHQVKYPNKIYYIQIVIQIYQQNFYLMIYFHKVLYEGLNVHLAHLFNLNKVGVQIWLIRFYYY